MTTVAPDPVLDLEALVREVRALASENPDYTYPRNPYPTRACDYVRDGNPSCLIAQAAARLGISVKTLTQWDDLAESGIGAILAYRYALTGRARDWLSYAQRQQDDGIPWGDVPAAADQAVGELASK